MGGAAISFDYAGEDLLAAVKTGDSERVRQILDREPGLARVKDAAGVSAILLAIYHGHPELVDAFLQHVELDFQEACAAGRRERVDYLLERDSGLVNQLAPDGYTPLGLAVFFGHDALTKHLLASGADVNAASQNAQRVTALHAAVARRNPALVKLLLDHGADPNAEQARRFTPLQGAAFHGDREIVELLLAHGADAGPKNDDGQTAADLAAECGHGELAGRLRA